MKSSIPYRLGFRVKRICSEESSYKIQKMKWRRIFANGDTQQDRLIMN
jgi:hypothetical protein